MAADTPIWDFVKKYAESGVTRAHMPGHKGKGLLGFERYDITEIKGADALYEAEGIIEQSRLNAQNIFGSGRTDYSTEGSSQCIRAMLALASAGEERPLILAARNVHKAFVYGCALLDIDVEWLMPESGAASVCACPITPEGVAKRLDGLERRPCALYITAPDYLGGSPDIRGIAQVCHKRGVPLLVDNAHGAYLKFLSPSRHPLDLGADMCCDSAHKTLPVLTGGAYLHISKSFLPRLKKDPRAVMAMFGSTSPSYLILSSLDRCNRYLTEGYPERLEKICLAVEKLRDRLRGMGYVVPETDPLKLTVFDGAGGAALAERLRQNNIEVEMADRWAVVMMFTPETEGEELERIGQVFASFAPTPMADEKRDISYPKVAMSPRQALMSPSKRVKADDSVGHVCADPSVSCPPAIPIAVSGEIITAEAVKTFKEYGIEEIEIVDL